MSRASFVRSIYGTQLPKVDGGSISRMRVLAPKLHHAFCGVFLNTNEVFCLSAVVSLIGAVLYAKYILS